MQSSQWDRRQFLSFASALGAGVCVPNLLFGLESGPAKPDKKVAAITTVYHRYSHADDIITRFMEGYSIKGTSYPPPCQVSSLYIDQVGDTDIGRPLAKWWKVPVVNSIRESLTLGGDQLAVDGVLIVAEQGDYPDNAIGQKLYPRRKFFEEVVKVFKASKRSVPVFIDKHLSYSWEDAKWMYDQSRELGFPLMAGSSVPVAYRHPDLQPKTGTEWESFLSVGYGHFEIYGFHTLEALQVMAERRKGGETGVKAVQCLTGKSAWAAAERGDWDKTLAEAAFATVPTRSQGKVEEDDADALVFLIEYRDGLRGTAYVSSKHVHDFAFAGRIKDHAHPVACWYELPKPQRDHFSFLTQNVARMMVSGKASYPVERTLLTTGMLAALMESRAKMGQRIETPHLDIVYQPAS